MKEILCVIILVPFSVLSQPGQSIQRSALGVHFYFNQFKLKDSSSVKSYKNIRPGLAISYITGMTEHTDFVGMISGSFVDLLPTKNNGPSEGKDNLFLEADAGFRYKLLTSEHLASPYIRVGFGFTGYNGNYKVMIPAGAGVQVRMFEEVFLLGDAQYRMSVASTQNNHFYYAIGIAGTVGRNGKSQPVSKAYFLNRPPIPVGIPDTDGDGILDPDDICPLVKGILKYHGCPIPDSDGDGINDDNDSCPNVPGLIRYNGCPIPDRDGDGVNDELDQCPDVVGITSNRGCPLIGTDITQKLDFAAQHIFFETDRYVLLSKSFKALDSIVVMLNENPELKIDINGYTDNTGNLKSNKVLSERRATAVMNYFRQKGILSTRLSAKGFGSENPISDNLTTGGKAKNRRVELKAVIR